MDDIIEDLKYDGKHSFEDAIIPVEDAYKKWGSRIAIMGGIDMDFLCREKSDTIKKRVRKIQALADKKGAIAIGSGNAIPNYMPAENYAALLESTLFPE